MPGKVANDIPSTWTMDPWQSSRWSSMLPALTSPSLVTNKAMWGVSKPIKPINYLCLLVSISKTNKSFKRWLSSHYFSDETSYISECNLLITFNELCHCLSPSALLSNQVFSKWLKHSTNTSDMGTIANCLTVTQNTKLTDYWNNSHWN